MQAGLGESICGQSVINGIRSGAAWYLEGIRVRASDGISVIPHSAVRIHGLPLRGHVQRSGHGCGAGLHGQLVEDVLHVLVNGAGGSADALADLGI